MDKSLVNLTDTCVAIGVTYDYLRRLCEICNEEEDILCEILGDDKFESFKQMVESTNYLLESNTRDWLKDNFNIER